MKEFCPYCKKDVDYLDASDDDKEDFLCSECDKFFNEIERYRAAIITETYLRDLERLGLGDPYSIAQLIDEARRNIFKRNDESERT